MCKALTGAPKAPAVAPLPPEPAKVEKPAAMTQAADREKRKIRGGFGVQSTIATSGQGVTSGLQTAGKTLLGS